jgi:hypothetical protein
MEVLFLHTLCSGVSCLQNYLEHIPSSTCHELKLASKDAGLALVFHGFFVGKCVFILMAYAIFNHYRMLDVA